MFGQLGKEVLVCFCLKVGIKGWRLTCLTATVTPALDHYLVLLSTWASSPTPSDRPTDW